MFRESNRLKLERRDRTTRIYKQVEYFLENSRDYRTTSRRRTTRLR